ncbi:zinc-dependent peptidase [Flavobacterium sp. N3904]|uniref:zinc-dependent peptidase n=1 Tax=Flavobacterium sp. N3904 TaxID=2986835 RepID=UPI00222483E0|nr:zinc-dependent peptidase [Flavobacterium sp. N3904]
MENIAIVFTCIVFLLVVGLFIRIIFKFLEYCFVLLFERPFFVHFCPFPKPLSSDAIDFLNNEFAFYTNLSDKKKIYFQHRIARFIDEYEFVSRNNFIITEEVKVHVAATITMLSFGMRKYLCNVFDKIIIYPSVYYSNISKQYHKGEFNPMAKAVVFSWEDFLKGYDVTNDNLNLGIHEFAHVLHHQGLQSNDTSATLFSRMYNEINDEVSVPKVREQLIQSNYFRIYAFTNQFEFLAVILENFFETPQEFKKQFPNLYYKVSLMLNQRY